MPSERTLDVSEILEQIAERRKRLEDDIVELRGKLKTIHGHIAGKRREIDALPVERTRRPGRKAQTPPPETAESRTGRQPGLTEDLPVDLSVDLPVEHVN